VDFPFRRGSSPLLGKPKYPLKNSEDRLLCNHARVAKLADAPDLESGGAIHRGSSPLPGTINKNPMKYKTPTLREKVQQYETFLHLLNTAVTCCNDKMAQRLVSNADTWSYAHRVGNGELSDRKQQACINAAFHNLCTYKNGPESVHEIREIG
jgi:hypothetical protein